MSEAAPVRYDVAPLFQEIFGDLVWKVSNELFLHKEDWERFLGPDHPAVVVHHALDAVPGARVAARARELGDRLR